MHPQIPELIFTNGLNHFGRCPIGNAMNESDVVLGGASLAPEVFDRLHPVFVGGEETQSRCVGIELMQGLHHAAMMPHQVKLDAIVVG